MDPRLVKLTKAATRQVLMAQPRFAVAFDIDGVLTRAPNPIPGAKEAIELLQNHGVPFCLMTNGGGSPEAAKAKQVSELLGLSVPLTAAHVCLAHTPMRSLAAANALCDEPVLLVGKHYAKLKDVAATYGFTKAVTCDELHARWPHLYPDMPPPPKAEALNSSSKTKPTSMVVGHHLPAPEFYGEKGFKAVLCFTDALTWGRELQIVCDVLSSPGGDVSASLRDEQVSSDGSGTSSPATTPFAQHVPLYTACADFTYASQWPVPRFGAGAMRVALEHLWSQLSGNDRQLGLQQTIYGKPFPSQYRFVENLLANMCAADAAAAQAAALAAAVSAKMAAARGVAATAAAWYPETIVGSNSDLAKATNDGEIKASPLQRFYMVGDNPATDIRGAAAAGPHWTSILTRSGLWRGAANDNDEKDPADAVVKDVLEAVEWVLKQEHSMGGLSPLEASTNKAEMRREDCIAGKVQDSPNVALVK